MNDWDVYERYELQEIARANNGDDGIRIEQPIVDPRRTYAVVAVKLLVVVLVLLMLGLGVVAYVAYESIVFTFWLLSLA